MLRRRGGDTLLHVDAAQGFTKTLPNYRDIDLLSVSGHKLHAPVGIGALLVGERAYDRLKPLLYGGHQQDGMRPGTLPAALIAGLAEAVRRGFELRAERLASRRRFAEVASRELRQMGAVFNLSTMGGASGGSIDGVATTFSVRFPGVDADVALMRSEPYAAMSRGSACSGSTQSRVLQQLGLSEQQIQETIRVSWCHMTPTPDWGAMAGVVQALRKRHSPKHWLVNGGADPEARLRRHRYSTAIPALVGRS